ncbi:hypothetical protein D3C86_1350440 [compost metagenome]
MPHDIVSSHTTTLLDQVPVAGDDHLRGNAADGLGRPDLEVQPNAALVIRHCRCGEVGPRLKEGVEGLQHCHRVHVASAFHLIRVDTRNHLGKQFHRLPAGDLWRDDGVRANRDAHRAPPHLALGEERQ